MNIAIIPARAGSKRIPGKNIKLFAGKPMIAHSIEAACSAASIDRVIVSTDSHEIAGIAREYGADVPFMRPAHLSADDTPTMPVVAHALDVMADELNIQNVCLIYPTAPLLTVSDLDNAHHQWVNSTKNYIFSVVSYAYPVQRALHFNQAGELSMLFSENEHKRSQELDHVFHDAGMFYWGRKHAFASGYSVFAADSDVFEVSRWKAQDIDTAEDWEYAEKLYRVNAMG